MRTLSRRDANAFARAARRLGLASRVTEMCVEAGGTLAAAVAAAEENAGSAAAATASQRMSLFHALMDGCRRAVDMAGEDPKV